MKHFPTLSLRRAIPSVLVGLLIIAGLTRVTVAQEQQLDLTLSPPSFDLTTEPGKTIDSRLRVRNNGTAIVTLSVEVLKLQGSNDPGGAALQEISTTDVFSQWLQLIPSRITVPQQEWTDVPFRIVVPTDAAFGYSYALFFSPALSAPQTTTPATRLRGGVAVPIILNVRAPGAKAEGRLEIFHPLRLLTEYLPVDFEIRVSNTGNVPLKPRGNIFIRNHGEEDLALLEVNAELGSILPGGTRTFTASWTDGFLVREPVIEDGAIKRENGKPVMRLAAHWDKLTQMRMGRYSASLLLAYDDGSRDIPIEGTAQFWVIPYRALAVALGALLLLFFCFRVWLRSYVRRAMRRGRHK